VPKWGEQKMNDLQLRNGFLFLILLTNPKTLTLYSREIAEMIGKEHKELLRDIRKYENYLNEGKIALVDFFEYCIKMISQMQGGKE